MTKADTLRQAIATRGYEILDSVTVLVTDETPAIYTNIAEAFIGTGSVGRVVGIKREEGQTLWVIEFDTEVDGDTICDEALVGDRCLESMIMEGV